MNVPTTSNQPSSSLHWAAEQFLDFCRTKNLSTNTLRFYTDRLKRFSKFCEVEPTIDDPTSITTADIRRFISSLADSGLSTKTVNHYIQALKAFFSFLVEEEAIEKNPAARVKPQKLVKRIIGTFSNEQVSAMLSACDMQAFRGIRNYTIILTFLDTGIRVSELTAISLSGVHWKENCLTVMGKGRKERDVPFGNTLKNAMQKYLLLRGEIRPEEPLFVNHFGEPMTRPSVASEIEKLGIAAGVTGVRVSPHTFRHTFAKNWILNGGDPFSLQRILGHTTQEMVAQYVSMASSDLRTQHQRFSPVDHLDLSRKAKKIMFK